MWDVLLSDLLSSRGFEGQAAETALQELYRCGLTRPEAGVHRRRQ